MISERLLGELLKLSRADKLQVMQVLLTDLSAEEIASAPMFELADVYENWSPRAVMDVVGALPNHYREYEAD